MKTISLGFSTCPNDTFIFDAMVHHKIDTEGLNFELFLGDVEELNQMAYKQQLDVTKLSYHAYAHIWEKYAILNSGSALGRNNGPILISKKKIYPDEINDIKIAIPGRNTTANLLFSIVFPKAKHKIEYLFSDIEDAIHSNEVDAGLIIHETRFTYENSGLKKIIDLGEYWEQQTNSPIPLGGIVIKKSLDNELKNKIDKMIFKSIKYAFNNPQSSLNYIKTYAQEMSSDVMSKHIELYVNQFSFSLGDEGRKAIELLYNKAFDAKLINNIPKDIFVN
jgi:1,4-dihydroxy-6-naphthoate synthase